MKMESMDIVAKNIDKIAELFPSCITEKVDDKGNLKKAVNFDILKEILSEKSGGVQRNINIMNVMNLLG